MKRFLSVLLVIAMILSLSGCKRSKKETPPDVVITTPMNINGVSVTEYQIVYDFEGLDYNARAAEYIRAAIAALTGYSPAVVDDSAAKRDREIVVGETSRDISKELNQAMSGVNFAMLSKGGSVALEGNYFVIAAAAYYFVDTYVKAGDVVIEDATLVRAPIQKEAKNYILLIGDGMGLFQTMLYDYMTDNSGFSDGESLFYGYMLPSFGLAQTKSYSGVTDSAAAGTALSTGYKTNNRHIGMARDGVTELKSLTELAAELGKATAVMSTEAETGATPSTFSAHTDDRSNSDDIEADQEALTQKYGTVIDCGYESFVPNSVKRGLEGHITDTLSKVSADPDGFFLMYEEAHIDKTCDDMNMEGAFLAVIRFNQAIARFMEFAFYNPDTVVIITADHETGGLHLNDSGALEFTDTEHSDQPVPVFAWGEGTEFFHDKVVENINIAHFISDGMGAEGFGDRTGGWYTEIYGDGKELPIVPFD